MPLPADARALIPAARAVRERAYAPYSGFRVGAALRDAEGRIHLGCNVENAAFPEGTCAEAGAIAAMVAAGGTSIGAIAVVGGGDAPCAPCGGCRQKLAEFALPDCAVAMTDATGQHVVLSTVDALLPGRFALAAGGEGATASGRTADR